MSEGGNGHWYQFFAIPRSWTDAKAAAESAVFGGVHGHLVTIASQAENDWVWNAIDPGESWIGAFQPIGLPEPAGGWEWVTGEPWIFANWCPSEPSNAGGTEWVGGFMDTWPWCPNGGWNDVDGLSNAPGYVVEWDDVAVPVDPRTWGSIKALF